MAEERVQRRLTAILAADVVGYSRLMGVDVEGTITALTTHRGGLFQPCVADHQGRIVKTTGDGLPAGFASIVDAARCAVAFQQEMRERNADTAEDRRIDFRIGVNTGDVIIQHDDVYGEGVKPRGCPGLRNFSSVIGGSAKPVPRRILVAVTCLLCVTAQPGLAFSPKVLDSVVSVLPVWPGYERKEAGQTKPWKEPQGTAVAIMPGGYLVTNLHVIRRAVRVTVRLTDGRILPAKIIGGDPLTDLAILRVTEDLPVLPLGPEPVLAAPVCAVGNQFGLGLSVTCGVVSATHRTGVGFNPIEDFIQTDAVVNPGASGGALLDDDGRLVGVLSAIFTKGSDANLGVNFAATMRLVMRVVEDLVAYKKMVRGHSGLRVANLSERDRAHRVGAVIKRVVSGGPAAAAGLKAGDVIITIGERSIRKASDATSEIHMYRVGESIEITVLRNERPLTIIIRMSP